ncbi:acetolactate synthase [Wukongibacter sp. M2B1]|uniref:acetolactate synthase n=1 Tax=Wukongibacter sp. M2B1 TaxID=3088895 RepID=UPI003D79B1BD
MIIKQLSIFLENKAGRLTEVTEILADKEINIAALCIAETSDYGILRLIVNAPDKAVATLKEKGFSVSLTDVLCILIPHKIGALADATKKLSESNISVEYMYAFAMGDKTPVIIRVDEIDRANKIIGKLGIQQISTEDIYRL